MNEHAPAPFIRPRMETPEKRVERETPLESLEADTLKVESFDVFYDKVVRGEITSRAVLEAYAAGRFGEQDYLLDEKGNDVIKPDGGYIREPLKENQRFRLPKNQVELLSVYSDNRAEVEKRKQTALSEITGLRNISDLLLKASFMSEAELRARLVGSMTGKGIFLMKKVMML
ncbi:hypothetical protein HQ487_01890 [Candidatus Uhrbacteria bacterium]|nr:hypothetical protein [Candidatus Uhrbacteria bacterium]